MLVQSSDTSLNFNSCCYQNLNAAIKVCNNKIETYVTVCKLKEQDQVQSPVELLFYSVREMISHSLK